MRKITAGCFSASEKVFSSMLGFYERTLKWVLEHSTVTLCVLLITIAVNVYLF